MDSQMNLAGRPSGDVELPVFVSTNKVTLEHCALFHSLDPRVIARIQQLALERGYERGATIFEEGDPADELFILASGDVELDYTLPNNPNAVVRITRVGPGEVFAWSALAGSDRLTARARTLDRSRVYVIPARPLRDVLAEHAPTGFEVMSRLAILIASRLRDTRSQLRWLHAAI